MNDWAPRFWFKVRKTRRCWIWTAYKGKLGYGRFWLNGGPKLAHIVSYELHKGEVPQNRKILHKCDNPSCVRPTHLFLGSQKDNMVDASKKGRVNRKLTDVEIQEVRRLHGTYSMVELADKFDVSFWNIRDVIRGRTGKHVN